MLKINFSNQFKADYKLLKKQGFDENLLSEFLSHLVIIDETDLPSFYKNHSLKGDYKGYFECHLKPNCIIVYRQSVDFIDLVRIGSHSHLFKKYWFMKAIFSEFKLEDYLDDEEIRKEYLNQVLADGNTEELKRALFYIASSYGVDRVAKKANLNRESLYKMFRPGSKPRFESIYKIIRALDIKLACV